MAQRISPKINVGTMSTSELEKMIAEVVRRVLREERKHDYYRPWENDLETASTNMERINE
jgi:hypothetical protein